MGVSVQTTNTNNNKTNKFSNFTIEYLEEVTEDNYFKNNIMYEGPEGRVKLFAYYFFLDLAKQLTSTDEAVVKEGLRTYKEELQDTINKITI